MLFIQVLQRKETWHFDITSAIIGAVAAWMILAVLYSQRHQIGALAQQVWAPIKEWRRRITAGQGEKYIKALQENVKSLLLFHPMYPELVYAPPVFKAPSALPKTVAEALETPSFIEIPYEKLLDGASRIIITGSLGSGRTTAMVMTLWETVKRAEEGLAFEKIPLWIDLNNVNALSVNVKATPLDRLLQLALLSMPQVSTKWLQQQIRTNPSVILMDNWDLLSPDDRSIIATWIAELANDLKNSHWIVASDTQGYGILVEAGFVPIEIHTEWTDSKFRNLLQGWSKLLSVDPLPEDNEIVTGLSLANKAEALPMEIVLRSVLYLKTGKFPKKLIDTLDFLLEIALPTLNLGDDLEEMYNQARMISLHIITQVAKIHRLDYSGVTQEQLLKITADNLPAKEDQHKKLAGTVRKLITDTQLLSTQKKQWVITHYIWEDFLTAWYLTQQEMGQDVIQTHLNNPSWSLLVDFYIGLANDSGPLIESTLNQASIYNDHRLLLQACRWAMAAPEPCPWCSEVIKVLAKHFMNGGTHPDIRLLFGKYIGLVAGESSRAFFIKMLSTPDLEVRSAALRGLGWSGAPREMAILSAALNDENFEIKKSALLGLQDLGTPGATTLLERYLVETTEELAPIVAQVLAFMPDGHKVLQEAVQHSDLMVRRAALHGLGLINEPWAIALVEEIIRTDPQWLVRSAAETALSMQREELENQMVVLPQPNVEEIEWLIRWAAHQGSGLGIGEAAYTMLVRAIQQGNTNTKLLGILTLNQIGRQEHLTVLQPLLYDSDELVKSQANQVIQNITQRYQIYLGS